MRYMLLLFGNETNTTALDPMEDMQRHQSFTQQLAARGVQIQDGEALTVPGAARTLRPRDGEIVVTDGPFAELKDFLGGYYLIEAKDLDAALEAAKACPMYTAIEVRPVWEIPVQP